MGELPKAEISVYSPELESFSVETPGGRIHIRWDNEASATPNAQLAFFAESLATAGVYESWVNSCPLAYNSGNAPHKRDVLGTWFLSILAGHHRYAHITGLRGDGVSPQMLGMSKIVSEGAGTDECGPEPELASTSTSLQRTGRLGHSVDTGYRYHHQDAVRQA
jgi:hypothetical protein